MTHNPNTKDYSQRVYNRLVTTVTNMKQSTQFCFIWEIITLTLKVRVSDLNKCLTEKLQIFKIS